MGLSRVGVSRRPLVAILAAAGLLVGCGGGGPAQEQFVAAADQRCKKVLDAFPIERPQPGETAAQLAERNRRSSEFYRRLHTELKDLEAPEQLKSDFRHYLDRTDRQARNQQEMAAATRAEDNVTRDFLAAEFRAVNETTRSLRRKLGFKRC